MEATVAGAWSVPGVELSALFQKALRRNSTPLFDAWVQIPHTESLAAPRLQRQVHEILRWTGWSTLSLAAAVETTRGTVTAIASGHSTTELEGVPRVRERLDALHALCARLAPALQHDSARLDAVLTSPDEAGRSVMELLGHGDYAGAYMLALNMLYPDQGGFAVSIHPSRPGEASVALYD